MGTVARVHGLSPLLAPVRPSWKDRYPITPINRYIEWRRDDRLLFDPWLRTHERLGGRVLRCEQRSLEISAPVGDWERWTGIGFPRKWELCLSGWARPPGRVRRDRDIVRAECLDDPRGVVKRPSSDNRPTPSHLGHVAFLGHSGVVSNDHVGSPLLKRSLVSRWLFMAIASLWALGVAAFISGYHINESVGVLTVSVGHHTYVGNPPALTLYQKDRVIWEIALFVLGFVILSGTADLLFRTVRRLTAPGLAAIVAGGLLVAYSLFGLVYGLLGLGTVGVLVILAGLPMKPSSAVDRAVPHVDAVS